MLDGFDKLMIDFNTRARLEVAHYFFGNMKETVACHHNIATSRQGTSNRLVGLSTHDDGVAFGCRLEVLQVSTQMPGHRAQVADGVVLGCCDDDVHFNKE